MRNKNVLDSIISKYKAQPIGSGYKDIIVKREYMKNFIMDILYEEFNIYAIGWFEYCKTLDTENQLGMGGSLSIFYEGWFSEICFTDDFPFRINLTGNITEKYNTVMDHIKSINFHGNTFENTEILIPAFYLDVPDDWYNIYVDENGYLNSEYHRENKNGVRPYFA